MSIETGVDHGVGDKTVVIYFRARKSCLHNALLVNDELAQIECRDCGEKLNPFFAIKQLMRMSDIWKRQKAEADLAREAAEKKSRTKCEHCGRLTKVKVNVSQMKVIERMQVQEIE